MPVPIQGVSFPIINHAIYEHAVTHKELVGTHYRAAGVLPFVKKRVKSTKEQIQHFRRTFPGVYGDEYWKEVFFIYPL